MGIESPPNQEEQRKEEENQALERMNRVQQTTSSEREIFFKNLSPEQVKALSACDLELLAGGQDIKGVIDGHGVEIYKMADDTFAATVDGISVHHSTAKNLYEKYSPIAVLLHRDKRLKDWGNTAEGKAEMAARNML